MLVLGWGWVSAKKQERVRVGGRQGCGCARGQLSGARRDGTQGFPPTTTRAGSGPQFRAPHPQFMLWGPPGKAAGLTGELLLQLPDQSCCLLLLLRLLKPLALELRGRWQVEG